MRAFAVAGPSCWNELPVELTDLTVVLRLSLSTLRRIYSELVFSDGACTL